MTQGDRLKKLENGHKSHARKITEHARHVKELWEEVAAMRAKTAELQKQLDVDRATRDERMQEWDERIGRLVSGMGAFLAKAGVKAEPDKPKG